MRACHDGDDAAFWPDSTIKRVGGGPVIIPCARPVVVVVDDGSFQRLRDKVGIRELDGVGIPVVGVVVTLPPCGDGGNCFRGVVALDLMGDIFSLGDDETDVDGCVPPNASSTDDQSQKMACLRSPGLRGRNRVTTLTGVVVRRLLWTLLLPAVVSALSSLRARDKNPASNVTGMMME